MINVLFFVYQISLFSCQLESQEFDFPVDKENTSSSSLYSIRWVEVSGSNVTISMDVAPVGVERILYVRSDNESQQYQPEDELFELQLDAGEHLFWVEYTTADDEIFGKEKKIRQYIGDNRLLYRSEVNLPFAMDVWGQDDLVVIAGGINENTSMLLVDVSDVFNPSIVYRFENIGYVRDVKIFDNLLFAAIDPESDGCSLCDGVGIRIYEISQPSNPILLSEITSPTSAVHNLYYDQGFLYVASQSESTLVIFDLRTPTEPNRIATWEPNIIAPPMVLDPGIATHDMMVKDKTLYVSHGLGFSLVDVSNPYLPKDIADQYIEFRTHNIWPSENSEYIFTTREINSGPLQIWSRGEEDFELLYTEAHDIVTVHNVHIHENYAFVSWYTDGVYIFDVSTDSKLQPDMPFTGSSRISI